MLSRRRLILGESDEIMRAEEILCAPQRTLPPLRPGKKIRYGTIGHGLDLARLVWTSEEHVFSQQDTDLQSALPKRPSTKEVKHLQRQRKDFLGRQRLDSLLVDEGCGRQR